MDTNILTPAQTAEFREFCRTRREREITVRLKKTIVDASRREADRDEIVKACSLAKKLGALAVLVSPVNVALANKALENSPLFVICRAGGTGETLPSVKKYEVKKILRCGAHEIRLSPCYSHLFAGNFSSLRRELKKVRKAAKKGFVTLSLEDRALTVEDIRLGARAAREAGLHGVCVRGETDFLLAALEAGEGLGVEVSDVENAEQFNSLLRAGACRAQTCRPEAVARELFSEARETGDAQFRNAVK